MIGQLAIAADINGVIGKNGGLLYDSRQDLANFSRFTAGTVLVAGRKSAQEMIDCKMPLTSKRPMVVVSENDRPVICREASDFAHIYYAKSLAEAILAAKDVAAQMGLLGWTVVGGKSIYDQFLARRSDYTLDAYYLASITEPVVDPSAPDACVLAAGDPRNGLDAMMENPARRTYSLEMACGSSLIRTPVNFVYGYDLEAIDPKQISVLCGNVLRIDSLAGLLTIPLASIESYVHKRFVNSMHLHTKHGREFEIRLQTGAPGLRYLQHLIDKFLITQKSI